MKERLSRYFSRYFKLFDIITILYFLTLSLLIVIFHSRLVRWEVHLITHLGIVLLLILSIPFLEKFRGIKAVHFLRYWYLVFSVTFIYWDVGRYLHLVTDLEFDFIIQKMELTIFRQYPNLWVENLYHPVLNEIMQWSYAIYWFTIPVSTAVLYFRRKYDECEELLFVTFLTFYVCYIVFILFPVSGPRFHLAEYFSKPYEGLFLVPLLRKLVENAGLRGAAFPSSHVAVSVVIYQYLRLVERKIAVRFFLPAVILLSLATVYGRYHYFLDMFSGLIFGLLIAKLTIPYLKKNKSVG